MTTLSARPVHGRLADTLDEANFARHAAVQRSRQAQLLQVGGDIAGTFAVLWALAQADFSSGATSMLGPVRHDLEALRPGLDELRSAKLDILTAAQNWYAIGSQLAVAVPALVRR
jgi:hypothetical protein